MRSSGASLRVVVGHKRLSSPISTTCSSPLYRSIFFGRNARLRVLACLCYSTALVIHKDPVHLPRLQVSFLCTSTFPSRRRDVLPTALASTFPECLYSH